MAENIILEIRNCSKHFGGVRALDNVNMSIFKGRVNGLVGENGAGKTTMLNIITGMLQRDSGEIILEGKNYEHYSNIIAKKLGILMVTQHVQLFPEFTIAENMFLNEVNPKTKMISYKSMYEKTKKVFEEIGFDYDPSQKIGDLSYIDQQMIEICKVIYSKNQKIIILDEPTASLTDKDISLLFKFIRSLKEKNATFIYVSHHLEEIFEICDLVNIMRNGKKVYDGEVKSLDMNKLVGYMIGKDVILYPPKKSYVRNEVVLEVNGLKKEPLLKEISFKLKKGEILGIAGLRGSGSTEPSRIISGLDIADKGEIKINGKIVKYKSPKEARKLGIGYLSNNRQKYGLIPVRSVKENMSMGFFKKILKFFIIFFNKEKQEVNKYIKMLDIKTTSIQTAIQNLSGGNQQKVVLSRLIGGDYLILIMEDPAFGVDVNIKSEIHRIMYKIVESGKSILLISEDLTELIEMTDRIFILKNGYFTGEYNHKEIDYDKLKRILGEE